ncbi:Rho GTPase activating protein 10 [Podila epigama]|nr:Rho GTPase activating protein 10 [Podila epigama]
MQSHPTLTDTALSDKEDQDKNYSLQHFTHQSMIMVPESTLSTTLPVTATPVTESGTGAGTETGTGTGTGDALQPQTNIPYRKRASIHYPEGSSSAKRMSLHFGPRARSHSESWAMTPTDTVVQERQEQDRSSLSNNESQTSSSTTLKRDSSEASTLANTHRHMSTAKEEDPDPELMKTLASFLQGHEAERVKEQRTETAVHDRDATMSSELTEVDLVIEVRDFAYPKTHPYHIGQYPPEPEYEPSDIEEDEEEEEEEEEEGYGEDEQTEDGEGHIGEDRTHGQARGLYDFDAENSSELSFREGDVVWIHCRQFPGWFLGEMGGVTGLVPENYVQLL